MTNAERVKAMRKATGQSAQKFGDRYGIPLRTVQNWESGTRTAPDYVVDMLERIIQEDKAAERFSKYDPGSYMDEHDVEAELRVQGHFYNYNDVAAAFNGAENPDELHTGVEMMEEHKGGYLFIYKDGATLLYL